MGQRANMLLTAGMNLPVLAKTLFGSRANASLGYLSSCQDDGRFTGGTGIDGMLGLSGRLQPNDALSGPPESEAQSGLATANSMSTGTPPGLCPPPTALLAAARAPRGGRPKPHLVLGEVRGAEHLESGGARRVGDDGLRRLGFSHGKGWTHLGNLQVRPVTRHRRRHNAALRF